MGEGAAERWKKVSWILAFARMTAWGIVKFSNKPLASIFTPTLSPIAKRMGEGAAKRRERVGYPILIP